MRIVVGSRALQHFYIELPRNKDKEEYDLDLWISEDDDMTNLNGIDYHILPSEILNKIDVRNRYATPDMIYTIKLSHFCWDIFWEKTKSDILYLKRMGCKCDMELFQMLKKHWEKEHGNKDFLSLKMDKEDFFNDFVTYYYDHDYLHELVSYPLPPTYTKCLKEGEGVLIDKEKFFDMDFKEQVKMFREEITAIALERWIIPDNKKGVKARSWYSAYILSLKKTIISLTKNWANEFIIMNLEEFIIPDYSLFEHALLTLNMEYPIITIPSDDHTSLYLMEMAEDIFNVTERPCDYSHIQTECGQTGGSGYRRSIFRLGEDIYKVEYYSDQDVVYFSDIEKTLEKVLPKKLTVVEYNRE